METMDGQSSSKATCVPEELAFKSGSTSKLSTSMNRIKAFTKPGSHNYEQIGQPPESDKATNVRIFTNGKPLRPSRSVGHAGEVAVIIDDEQSTGNNSSTTTGQAPSNRANPGNLYLPSSSTVDGREHWLTHERVVTELDSFDDVPQFAISKTGHSFTASAAVPVASYPKGCIAAEKQQRVGLEGGSHERVHQDETSRKSSLKDSSFGCSEGSSAGADTALSSRERRTKSFDFGTIPQIDPATRLIGEFLRRQTESESNFLDLDMDMDELNPGPISRWAEGGKIYATVDLEKQSPSPQRTSLVKETSYADLVEVDRGTSSDAAIYKAPRSPNGEERWKESVKYRSDPLLRSPMQEQDIRLNVVSDDRNVQNLEVTMLSPGRSSTGEKGVESADGGVGLRSRRNQSSLQISPTKAAAEEQVLKAPVLYVSRPSFKRLKSRLADLPKPPKAAGTPDEKGSPLKSEQLKTSGQLRSGMVGKVKKVEEEEEDPLKVTDLPEKFRKRDKGFWAILQWIAFILICGGLISILSFSYLRKMKRGGLLLWKWALLVMVVFSGRLISGWIIWALVFIIERNFLLRKKVVYFVYALRKGVQNCLWLGFALLAWHFMIDPKVDKHVKVVRYVTKVLVCFIVAAVIVLVKTLIVKVFASSFHVSNFFERIQEALFSQYIMETLAGPPIFEIQNEYNEEQKLQDEISGLKAAGATGPSLTRVPDLPAINVKQQTSRPTTNASGPTPKGEAQGTQSGMIWKSPPAVAGEKLSRSKKELNKGISVEYLQRLDQSNISAWNMKRLIHIIRHSTLTHSLEETVNAAEGMETEIQSEWQAKSAAKQIFKNVAKPGQKVITEDDLLRFMGEEETRKALPLFDGAAETKSITKQALKKWVIDVYRERRSLALSLNDTKTAVNKLHQIINVVVGILIIIIWLLVLGIATTKLLLFMSSQILLLILVWGNTLKTVFEAIVFLFVMHPFDVGDRCVVDGMQLVVEEMNILTTVFLGDFNVKVWFPNSVLATKPIQNYYRSPEMGDVVEFIVQSSTPMEKVAAFKENIGRYILSKPNHWHPEFVVNVLEMSEGQRMKLALGLKHTMNWQDLGEKVKRKSELLVEVKACLLEQGIQYRAPAQEIHVRQLTE